MQQNVVQQLVKTIEDLEKQIAKLEDEKTTSVVVVEQNYDEQILPMQERLFQCIKLLSTQVSLQQPGKDDNFFVLNSKIVWRKGRNYVAVTDSIDSVINRIQQRDDCFLLLRSKLELNRAAILSNPNLVENVDGLTVRSGEPSVLLKTTRREYNLKIGNPE